MRAGKLVAQGQCLWQKGNGSKLLLVVINEKIMELARVTAKSQATIPKRIGEAANIQEGVYLACELDGNNRIISKRVDLSVGFDVSAFHGLLSESASSEGEEAWRDL